MRAAGVKVDVDLLNPAITAAKQQWDGLPEPVRQVAPFAGARVATGGAGAGAWRTLRNTNAVRSLVRSAPTRLIAAMLGCLLRCCRRLRLLSPSGVALLSALAVQRLFTEQLATAHRRVGALAEDAAALRAHVAALEQSLADAQARTSGARLGMVGMQVAQHARQRGAHARDSMHAVRSCAQHPDLHSNKTRIVHAHALLCAGQHLEIQMAEAVAKAASAAAAAAAAAASAATACVPLQQQQAAWSSVAGLQQQPP